MPVLSFGEWRPDVSDYNGQTSRTIKNVFSQGDGYGPVPNLAAYTAALPAACRGYFYARKSDGSVQIFAGTSDRLYTLNNTTQTWTPVSVLAAVTSITNANPGVVNYTAHGFAINDPVVFAAGVGVLPSQLVAGTVYFIVSAGFGANAFSVAATVGGTAIDTTGGGGSGSPSITSKYTAVATTAHWQFVQFNNFVLATQVNAVVQVYDLTSSLQFAVLGGSPPQAAYIAIVNRFVFLSGLATPNVYRIHWSGLNATTTWTSGVNQSDFQDLPDGGIVRGIAGGEFGLCMQDNAIRMLTYAPGSPYVFSIDRISQDDGLKAPYSMVSAGDKVFFLSPHGFKQYSPGAPIAPIGKEKVDRLFAADADFSSIHLVIAVSDPESSRVFWAYKSTSGQTGLFDKMICYDYLLQKWTDIRMIGEYISAVATPGLTLEGVDAAYGSNIDTLTLGSFDNIELASFSSLSAFNSDHKLGFFTGPNLEAVLETPEQGGDGTRFRVNAIRPVTDATAAMGSVFRRETAVATSTQSTETAINAIGICPQRVSTRYARARLRIPAAATWTYAAGIEPDVPPEGGR
jgi:hypothetical protein